jgi:hypothetical protein
VKGLKRDHEHIDDHNTATEIQAKLPGSIAGHTSRRPQKS